MQRHDSNCGTTLIMGDFHVTIIAGFIVGFLTIIGGLAVATLNLWASRKFHRRDRSIEMMSAALWKDGQPMQAIAQTIKIADNEDIAEYVEQNKAMAADEEKEWVEKRRTIAKTLNYFEVISAGIRQNLYDRTLVRTLMRSLAIRVYEKTSPFIEGLRNLDKQDRSCVEFEKLVKEWQKESS